jgi:hypothetical protein
VEQQRNTNDTLRKFGIDMQMTLLMLATPVPTTAISNRQSSSRLRFTARLAFLPTFAPSSSPRKEPTVSRK